MAKHTFSTQDIDCSNRLPPPPYTHRSADSFGDRDNPTFDRKRAYRLLRTKYGFRAKEAFAIAEAWSVFELAEESVRVVALFDENHEPYDWAASDENPNKREAAALAKKLRDTEFFGIGLAYATGRYADCGGEWEPDYETFVWGYDDGYVREASLSRLPELLDEYRTAVAERTLPI